MIYVFSKKVSQMYNVKGVSGNCLKLVYMVIFMVYTILLGINID